MGHEQAWKRQSNWSVRKFETWSNGASRVITHSHRTISMLSSSSSNFYCSSKRQRGALEWQLKEQSIKSAMFKSSSPETRLHSLTATNSSKHSVCRTSMCLRRRLANNSNSLWTTKMTVLCHRLCEKPKERSPVRTNHPPLKTLVGKNQIRIKTISREIKKESRRYQSSSTISQPKE